MNNHIDKEIFISEISRFLPPDLISEDPDLKVEYGGDWCKSFQRSPFVILFPKSTEQVANILSYCSHNNLTIVPSGGRTGLAGGAAAQNNEIVLSLEKMNKILNIDPISMTAEVESGVTTQALQEAAKAENLFFPLDLAAKGSSQIGGNISTNAGGLKFIRFGGARDQVIGLEVVLPSGEVLNLNTQVRKNNCGYDLKQLFIGSEGTLGVITKATLKLTAPPHQQYLSCIGLNSIEQVLKLLKSSYSSIFEISAFEYLSGKTLQLVTKSFAHMIKNPFETIYPYYVILELESQDKKAQDHLELFFEELFNQNLLNDAVIANSSEEESSIWSIRENISEALAMSGPVIKNDVSIPIHMLSQWEVELSQLEKKFPHIETYVFGHIGDGNLHINYLGDPSQSIQDFQDMTKDLQSQVYSLVQRFNGSISAEHGIGLLKKNDLHFSRSLQEINYMRQIKKIFDPQNILNPGKIFD